MKQNKKLRFRELALMFPLVAFLSACDGGDSRLREKATIEGEAAARRQVEAENDRLRGWASQMEEELTRRHRFFEGVSGVYEGTIDVPGLPPSSIRIILNPSIPRYPDRSRARTIEELSFELSNLNFVGQALTWHQIGSDEEPREDGFGCTFEAVRPDMRLGKIYLASENCRSTFTVFLSEMEDDVVETDNPGDLSTSLSRELMEGTRDSVTALVGVKQTNISSRRFRFRLRRSLND